MQFSSKSIEYLIYHTGSQKEYYNRYFPWIAEKSEFIRFGTDLEFFRPEKIQKTKDRGTYILCVGYSKRDWDTLIEAYKLLHADIKLRLVGHIDERYASIPGVEQVAFIPINVLIEQIYNSLFGVLPLQSFNYSYGQMTLMQQMALEKCVIAAKVPSLIDYVENDVTAVLYEPQNSMELAAKMREILDNKEKREKIGKQGRKFLENKCNEKTMAKSIEQVIIKLMRNTD
jgi:glycosyltransferase involved in cell wall biosynthesis